MVPASRTRYTAADVRQVLAYWDNFVDDSDMVIEVLCNQFCRRLPFVYDHTMCTVVVRWTLMSVSPASRPPRCCGLNFPSSDTNMVNFHID